MKRSSTRSRTNAAVRVVRAPSEYTLTAQTLVLQAVTKRRQGVRVIFLKKYKKERKRPLSLWFSQANPDSTLTALTALTALEVSMCSAGFPF